MKETQDKKAAHRNSRTRPNIVHPTLPGAVGSMESPYREGRDTVEESRMIIDDTIENVTGKKQAHEAVTRAGRNRAPSPPEGL